MVEAIEADYAELSSYRELCIDQSKDSIVPRHKHNPGKNIAHELLHIRFQASDTASAVAR